MNSLKAQFIDNIQAIPKAQWNGLAGLDYPFMRHEFLAALEASGSVADETGWTPQHLTIYDDANNLAAIVPLYIKDHSYGEYVFDWAWANAYYQHGLDYYPKLLTAIPFTPCVGPRLLIDNAYESATMIEQCIHVLLEVCQQNSLSSWHLLFPQPNVVDVIDRIADKRHLMKRIGSQFHWYNQGYETFADYLGAMTSRKRKSIRKEREKVAQQGITFLHVPGTEMSDIRLEEFYIFYHATYMKRGQQGYLNRQFFALLIATMPENLLFVFAQQAGESVAAALFLTGGDTIYGRYWGCLAEYDQLHFETCYYQGIDYCIEQGLQHFDAGAQGEHKIQRGFEPIKTYSYHWIAHPGFRNAIDEFLVQEDAHICEYIAEAKALLPFKQAP